MALDELKGTELGSQTVTIEEGPVRKFAASLKDDPARYVEGSTAPVTWPFVMPFWGAGLGGAGNLPMDKLRGAGRMILHGEQEFDYHRPVRIGETLTGTSRISDVYEKDSSSATMEFYVKETSWADADGNPVVDERFSLIVRVKKG
ncbi:MAG TPA: MaoC family dehydratase N-terminal domain-containing protein [Microthrixaceae bacterium]|nr:MaoC family dehydratase N-terminal domain-containing protein [Microthrixaceae bacterium]